MDKLKRSFQLNNNNQICPITKRIPKFRRKTVYQNYPIIQIITVHNNSKYTIAFTVTEFPMPIKDVSFNITWLLEVQTILNYHTRHEFASEKEVDYSRQICSH